MWPPADMHSTDETRSHQHRRIEHHARRLHAYDFFNLLTGDALLNQVDRHLPPHRERLYPPTETLSLFMAQTLNPDRACQPAVNRYAVDRHASGLAPCSTHTGGYCRARQRLPLEMVRSLAREAGQLIARQAQANWHWLGRPVKLVDGTTVTLPDTPMNQADYPQQSNQKPGLGFPIARWVGLLCAATGAVLDAAIGPYSGKMGSEQALFRDLLGSIAAGDLILADRYYCAYFVIAMLQAQGADVLFQQHQRRHTDFRKGRRLGTRDHIVAWVKPKTCPNWLTREQFDAFPDSLEVRELKVGHKVLVTTLLCAEQAPKKALGELYISRWSVELDLRNIKTTLGLERLHCKTPEMNKKELWVGLLAYNLIRLLMAESAKQADVLPRLLSFKHSLQLWLAWSHSGPPGVDEADLGVLYNLIAQQRVGDRPGRIEPRAIKRRAKPYPLLMKPRTKTREEVRRHGHPKKLK
jgi:hypothetical protein